MKDFRTYQQKESQVGALSFNSILLQKYLYIYENMNQVSRQGIKCIFVVYKYLKGINSRNKQVFMWDLKQSYKLKANKIVTQVCRRNVFPWIIVSSNYFDMKFNT